MIVVAVCPVCSVYRYKSKRDMDRKAPLNPDDFDPIPPQLPAAKDEKAICVECGADLKFRFVDSTDLETSHRRLVKDSTSASAAVSTLFEARPGEEVSSIRELGPDRLLVVTNRRVLVINLETLLIGANGHGPSA